MRYWTALVAVAVTFTMALPLADAEQILTPVIDGQWWQVAGDPDLGQYTREEQQPVDFGVWQAADGTWQLWSCIRGTGCGGAIRLFYRWEGQRLTDENWTPMGIKIARLKWLKLPELGKAVFDFNSADVRDSWILKSGNLASVFTNSRRLKFQAKTTRSPW